MGITTKQIWLIVLAIFVGGLLFTSGKLIEFVDNSEYVIIQGVGGNLKVCKEAGPVWQGFGTATHYKKSNQFWFSKLTEEGDSTDQSIKVRFNDGGHANLSGSVRWYMPNDDKSIIKLHTDYGSQAAVEIGLIKQVLTKAIYMTGPLMSSKESSAEKRNDLLSYVEDQAINGVYKTKQIERKIIDELEKEKIVTVVEIQKDEKGVMLRNEKSMLASYNISLQGLAFNSIDYTKDVEAQIKLQQNLTMQVQTSIANAKKSIQDAITTEQKGKADAAAAKWKQEVIKATLVTEAQQKKEVAELDVKTAELNKRKQILEGEGEAAKKRLVMQANGALEQKLETWLESQKYWAEAFGKYQGNVVPTYSSGGGGGGNGAINFMEVMGAKAAKDLMLDFKNK